MILTKTVRLITIAALLLALSLPLISHAQGIYGDDSVPAQKGFVPLSDANFQKLFGVNTTEGSQADLGTFMKNAFRVALSLGAILAVMRIAWGGYQYMWSEATDKKSKAKEILGDVVIGLLLLLSAWLILNQINPKLLEINLPKLDQKTPAQQLQEGTTAL